MSTLLIASSSALCAQTSNPAVKVVGEMRSVMWKGELQGTIDLDTLSTKAHLYGLGPVEYLAGELLVLDGKAFRSTVVSPTEMLVEETFQVKAPFFSYTTVEQWKEQKLPASVRTIKQLESYLDYLTKGSSRPFFFRLVGTAETAEIHVVNLPKGASVSSPDEAHQGKTSYPIANETVEIVGFFSTAHQAIFTHHDTFLHMHLITEDRKKMGHLDQLLLQKGTTTLYLAAP